MPALFKPTRYITGVINGNQAVATLERTIAYARHAVRNSDRGQFAASGENIAPYARHAVPDGDGSQAAATAEGRRTYARPSRYDDLFQGSGNIVVIVAITRRPEDVSEVRIRCPVLCRADKRQCYAFKRVATRLKA